jgi:hypothetical protein
LLDPLVDSSSELPFASFANLMGSTAIIGEMAAMRPISADAAGC